MAGHNTIQTMGESFSEAVTAAPLNKAE